MNWSSLPTIPQGAPAPLRQGAGGGGVRPCAFAASGTPARARSARRIFWYYVRYVPSRPSDADAGGGGAARAGVAESADAPDLGSGGATREGSSPFARTMIARRPVSARAALLPRCDGALFVPADRKTTKSPPMKKRGPSASGMPGAPERGQKAGRAEIGRGIDKKQAEQEELPCR